ncbi:MAG: iron-containing alcohol dehydrogenase [Thermodesulforhabdaceae bacterium]
MSDITRYGEFFAQPVSLIGVGAVKRLPALVKTLGKHKALICTDKGVVGIACDIARELKDKAGIAVEIFDGVIPNPSGECVEKGYQQFLENQCDMLISVGGGSSHDTAKAIGVMVSHGGSLWDYVGINKLQRAIPPVVSINTTAGTGSEVTRFAVITNLEKKTKLTIIDWRLVPIIAVNDPELMIAMPPPLTAATGMDALTHAIEAYVSRSATPITDTLALKAINLISKYLRKAFANGKDIEARSAMAYGQYLAGLAFNSAGVGCVHAVAHQLGGLYNLPHGICNAVLLPWIQGFNLIACIERLADIAVAMGEGQPGLSVRVLAERAIEAMRILARDLGIPERLRELGVKEEDIPNIATGALNDPSSFTNPRKAGKEELMALLRKAL